MYHDGYNECPLLYRLIPIQIRNNSNTFAVQSNGFECFQLYARPNANEYLLKFFFEQAYSSADITQLHWLRIFISHSPIGWSINRLSVFSNYLLDGLTLKQRNSWILFDILLVNFLLFRRIATTASTKKKKKCPLYFKRYGLEVQKNVLESERV